MSNIINVEEINNHPNNMEGTATFFKTCFNVLNALSGLGMISLPYALSCGGWLSFILFFTIAASTLFTGILIQKCMDLDTTIKTYPDIGGHAFGRIMRVVLSIFMYLQLYFVSTGFLILEGDNLHNLFPEIRFEYSWINVSGRVGFVIIVALLIFPSMLLRDLSKLSYLSATGFIASVILIAAVLWTGAVAGVGFHEKGKVLNLNRIPMAVSLYTFSFSAHPVFPALYTSMTDRKQFNKVLIICFVICTACYTSMAVMGYLMYGEKVNSQVTLNLPIGKISSKIAIYTTLVNPLAKYALMATPVVSAIENCINSQKRLVNVLIRTLFLISTVVVALAVPFFGDLMSLVGAFLDSTACIILPCICYLKMSGRYKTWNSELLITIGVIIMGISIVVIGTYTSLSEIIGHMQGKNVQK